MTRTSSAPLLVTTLFSVLPFSSCSSVRDPSNLFDRIVLPSSSRNHQQRRLAKSDKSNESGEARSRSRSRGKASKNDQCGSCFDLIDHLYVHPVGDDEGSSPTSRRALHFDDGRALHHEYNDGDNIDFRYPSDCVKLATCTNIDGVFEAQPAPPGAIHKYGDACLCELNERCPWSRCVKDYLMVQVYADAFVDKLVEEDSVEEVVDDVADCYCFCEHLIDNVLS